MPNSYTRHHDGLWCQSGFWSCFIWTYNHNLSKDGITTVSKYIHVPTPETWPRKICSLFSQWQKPQWDRSGSSSGQQFHFPNLHPHHWCAPDCLFPTWNRGGFPTSYSPTSGQWFHCKVRNGQTQFLNGPRFTLANPSVTSPVADDTLVYATQKNIQLWNNLLWMSGGNLNPQKCFTYTFWPKICPMLSSYSSLHQCH